MKKSINLGYLNCLDKDFLKFLKNLGFDGIDFGIGEDQSFWNEKDWDEAAYKLKETVESEGLRISQVHLPCYEIFTSSEISDEETEKHIKYTFKLMNILGTKWGAYHPMSSTNFDYDRKRAMHDNKERIKSYLEEASKYGSGIAVENIPVFPDCPQYHFFTSDLEDHIELVDSFKSPYVGVCWDFGHANLMPYDKAKVLDEIGSRIKIIHAHSNFGDCDWHLCPALGNVNWGELMPILMKNGFEENFSMEINSTDKVNKGLLGDVRKSYIEFCAKAADAIIKNIK